VRKCGPHAAGRVSTFSALVKVSKSPKHRSGGFYAFSTETVALAGCVLRLVHDESMSTPTWGRSKLNTLATADDWVDVA
jgi:hypothetical protein